jgi:hypothetical protein
MTAIRAVTDSGSSLVVLARDGQLLPHPELLKAVPQAVARPVFSRFLLFFQLAQHHLWIASQGGH